jgi:uncharacterized membrane protein
MSKPAMAVAALLPLTLAGCGGGSMAVNAADNALEANMAVPAPAPANAAAPAVSAAQASPTPSGTMLGSVDLAKPIAGSGSEPFWGIDITGGSIVYTDASVEPIQPESFAPTVPVLSEGSAVYSTTRADGSPVVVTLTTVACIAPSGKSTSLTVTIQTPGGTRTGCAGPA